MGKSRKIRKIDIDSLSVGMYVNGISKHPKGEDETTFEMIHIITHLDEVEKYRSEGVKYAFVYMYVYFQDLDEDGAAVPEFVPFETEIKRAEELRREAEGVVNGFMSKAGAGEDVDIDDAGDIVARMVDSVFRNKDALLSLSRIKDFANYTFAHSINVCILSLAFARHLGYQKMDMHTIGFGAILHDIGKMLVPDEILNKPGALTEEEFAEMMKHPALGAELLRDTFGVSVNVMKSALQHHERYNGSGYPEGITSEGINPFVQIVAIADVYDAMTSKRVYREKQLPKQVLGDIYSLKGSDFEAHLVDEFVLCLGIYPVGSMVKLNTGEVGMVKSVNQVNLLKPVITLLLDSEGKKYPKPFDIDFFSSEEREIVSVFDSSTYSNI